MVFEKIREGEKKVKQQLVRKSMPVVQSKSQTSF